MQGILLRVGIDQSGDGGNWNAPVDPDTGNFVYIPIPEGQAFKEGLEVRYSQFTEPLAAFSRNAGLASPIHLPGHLNRRGCHLDPDFYHLTYGDQGRRGGIINRLGKGDFIAFFAGLRPVRPWREKLFYGLIGLFVVDRVCRVDEISQHDVNRNAHTRRRSPKPSELVVFADPRSSGRFQQSIPIGSYRRGAYRVTKEHLEAWGGLNVKDGYIQRSVNPPQLKQPETFLRWLESQAPSLIHRNN